MRIATHRGQGVNGKPQLPTRAWLVALVFAAACMTLASAEEDENVEALRAAASNAICGPEGEGLVVLNGHEFNVKKATVVPHPEDNTPVQITGEISHRLTVRPDDDIYYIINYKDGLPEEPQIDINRGGLASIAGVVADVSNWIGVPTITIAGIEIEPGFTPEKASEIATAISKLIEGRGWEDQAVAMITYIAYMANQPAQDVCPE